MRGASAAAPPGRVVHSARFGGDRLFSSELKSGPAFGCMKKLHNTIPAAWKTATGLLLGLVAFNLFFLLKRDCKPVRRVVCDPFVWLWQHKGKGCPMGRVPSARLVGL